MVSPLVWLLLLPALQFSLLLLLLLLSSPSPLRVQPPAQLSESGRNREQVPSGPGDRDLSSPGVVARLQPSQLLAGSRLRLQTPPSGRETPGAAPLHVTTPNHTPEGGPSQTLDF